MKIMRKVVGAFVLFGVLIVLALDYCLFAFGFDTISDVSQDYFNRHGKPNAVIVITVAAVSFAVGMLVNHLFFQF